MKNNMKECRREAGLTFEGLAEASGISLGALYKLEHGRVSPKLETAYAVAAALGRPVTDVWPDETEVVEEVVTVRRVRAKT